MKVPMKISMKTSMRLSLKCCRRMLSMNRVHQHVLTVVLTLCCLSLAAVPAVSQDRPRIAVLEFAADSDTRWWTWWRGGGASAVQDVMVTELVKTRMFSVIERERLDGLLREQNLSLSGAVDTSTAVRAGRLLGVKYLVVGAVTEYGARDAGGSAHGVGQDPSISGVRTFTAAMNAHIIDVETGEIVWLDDARNETRTIKPEQHVGRFGGGASDDAMFDRLLKPTVQDLVASIRTTL